MVRTAGLSAVRVVLRVVGVQLIVMCAQQLVVHVVRCMWFVVGYMYRSKSSFLKSGHSYLGMGYVSHINGSE